MSALEQEIARTGRFGTPLSLVLFDLDRFKRVNDRCGHQVGDIVLRRTADAVRTRIRGTDLAARIGGEEFAILLPGSDTAGAVTFAENLRLDIRREVAVEGVRWPTTASFGVAEFRAGMSIETLVGAADRALYQAKAEGRDRVCTAAAGDAGGPPPSLGRLALDLVLAVLLGTVQRAVSGLEQHIDLAISIRGDSHARRDPVRARAAAAELALGERGDEAFGGLPCAGEVGLGQENGKLVPAETGGEVDLAEVFAEHVGHVTEDAVAGGMPEGVVDSLEVVDVYERDGERPAGAAGADEFGRSRIREGTSVGQVREVVRRRVARVAGEPHERTEGWPGEEASEQEQRDERHREAGCEKALRASDWPVDLGCGGERCQPGRRGVADQSCLDDTVVATVEPGGLRVRRHAGAR